MRMAVVVLAPLLFVAGCATTAAGGPHAHGAREQSMANCPMPAAAQAGGEGHGGMAGGHQGQMMDEGHMMHGMHQDGMANCPGASDEAAPPAAADEHQH